MGLKRRAKVNAEFSMSSLTDIIFLLLIFFMLTSTLVNLNQFDLPESNSKTVAPMDIVVAINQEGEYFVNGKKTRRSDIYASVKAAIDKSKNRQNATVSIVAEVGVPFDNVINVMTTANRLKAKAILMTQPTS